MPAGSAVIVKLPVAVVTVGYTALVSMFFAETAAPGTMALAGSCTVPVITPRSDCAAAIIANKKPAIPNRTALIGPLSVNI